MMLSLCLAGVCCWGLLICNHGELQETYSLRYPLLQIYDPLGLNQCPNRCWRCLCAAVDNLRVQVFELVLEQIGARPEDTVFVDDSLRNVAAAHDLGIYTVLVAPQLAGQHAPGADVVVSCFTQLREVLPQVCVQQQQQQQKRAEVPAGVPVSVMAS